jgi:DNA primase
MANPGDLAYTVKQQADIVRVIGGYIQLKKSGAQNFSGLCPFHQEKTPSFSVHATRQYFHCFGCGKSGDVFTFVQELEKITFPEAIRLVAQKLDIKLPKMEYSSPAEAQEARQRGQLIEMHERACAFFEDQLRRPEGAHARQYLSGRGLTDEIIREFRIGYAPDSGFLLKDRLKSDFNDELMRASGLFSSKEGADANLYSKFRNRVMFPIAQENGKIIAFTARTLSQDDKSGPKYLNSPETPLYSKSHVLYNLDKAKEPIRKLGYAVIVEGQMDCISVYAAGFRNVIASSGTAFTETQVRLLKRFTDQIVVNFDPDTAGAAATDRSLAMLLEEDFKIKVLQLDSGYDPDLFIRKNGAKGYEKALGGSLSFFDYLVARAIRTFPVQTPEGKQKAVSFLLPYIQHIPSRIVRDSLSNDIAQKLGIDTGVLRQEFKTAATKRGSVRVTNPATDSGLSPSGERHIVRLLFRTEQEVSDLGYDPRELIFGCLSEFAFHEGFVTERLIQAAVNQKDEMDDVLGLELSAPDRQLLMRLIATELPIYSELELKDLISVQTNLRLTQMESDLPKQMQEAFSRGDLELFKELSKRKMQLSQRMRPLADISRRGTSNESE